MTSTEEWPQVAVVIPTYERPDRLKATVESVCEQTIDDYEVVVVDDGSSDERQLVVLDSLNDRFGRVRVSVSPTQNQWPLGTAASSQRRLM
jgi:glycosyltransferase involved in cell wall biosynthesis